MSKIYPAGAKRTLLPDPAKRQCPDCIVEINEAITLDSTGTCHGCGRCFGDNNEN